MKRSSTSPANRGSGAETIAERIRRAVRSRELLPGEQIRQADWADQLGTSRVVVREALKILATEGLLTHDANRGFFVTRVSLDEMQQLYWLRAMIEKELIRTLIWPDVTYIDMLRADVDALTSSFGSTAVDWTEQHNEFHFKLLALSPRGLLVDEARRLWTRTEIYRSIRRFDAADAALFETHHLAVIDALERRDRSALTRSLQHESPDLVELLRPS